MATYEIGSGKLVPLSSAGKNELEIGRVLLFNGYSNDEYVICKNMGIDSKWGSGARYQCVNLRTFDKLTQAAIYLKWLSDKKDGRIDVYITDKILSADEVLDAWQAAEARELVQQVAAEKKAKEKAEALAALPSLYPTLVTIEKSGKSSAATGAMNIKKELAAAFPGVKFSVKSEYYSGGSSIRVNWNDGPTREQVEQITNKYQQGSFDGMTDCYNYADEIFTQIFGGAKYVSENRDYSADFYEKSAEKLGYGKLKFNNQTWDFEGLDQDQSANIKREVWKVAA